MRPLALPLIALIFLITSTATHALTLEHLTIEPMAQSTGNNHTVSEMFGGISGNAQVSFPYTVLGATGPAEQTPPPLGGGPVVILGEAPPAELPAGSVVIPWELVVILLLLLILFIWLIARRRKNKGQG